MPIEQCWPDHKLKLTECAHGLHVQQDGKAYVARAWTLCDEVVKIVDEALDCGFTCLIRHSHPKPSNRDERGVQYIGFSRSAAERWVFVIDQYSCPATRQRDRINTVTFEKHYRTTLERALIPFTDEGAGGRKGGQNLFVPVDRVADAIRVCAEEAEAVEQIIGAREWEDRKAHLGFVTEAVLESYVVQHWHTLTGHAEIGTPQSVLEAQAGHLSKRMSDLYKHISEKAARKASDELSRVKTEQRAEARAKLQEKARTNATGSLDSLTLPTVADSMSDQMAVVH